MKFQIMRQFPFSGTMSSSLTWLLEVEVLIFWLCFDSLKLTWSLDVSKRWFIFRIVYPFYKVNSYLNLLFVISYDKGNLNNFYLNNNQLKFNTLVKR